MFKRNQNLQEERKKSRQEEEETRFLMEDGVWIPESKLEEYARRKEEGWEPDEKEMDDMWEKFQAEFLDKI